MNNKKQPDLTSQQADQLIAEVDRSDRQAARLAISQGVETAQKQWLQPEFIADALAQELSCFAKNNLVNHQAAAYLRQLAAWLDEESDLH